MINLKRLATSLALMSILSATILAGETNSPPCTEPGQTSTPPCSQSVTGSTDPGETSSPPANAVDLTTVVEAVELALSLF